MRLSETASGYERLLWRQAWLQLKAAVEDGWRNHGFVWASAPGAYQAVHVNPGDFQTLTAHFPPSVTAYSELISKPGLVAFVSVDRSTSRFMGVTFKHRP